MIKTLECFKDCKHWLILIFVSVLFISFGIVHDAFADQVIAKIPAAGPLHGGGVAINPNTNLIYVREVCFCSGSLHIDMINGTTNQVQDLAGSSSYDTSLAINPNTNLVYFTTSYPSSTNSVTVINGSTGITVTTIPVGTDPQTVAVNPNTDKIYVGEQSQIQVIDGLTNNIIATIPSSHPSFAINSDTDRIYASGSGGVQVIDGSTNTVSSMIQGTFGNNMAVDTVRNLIFLQNQSNNNIVVINGSTNMPVATFFTSHLGSFVVNPFTQKIYMPADGGDIEILNETNYSLIQTIPIPPGVFGINLVTDRIYVSDGNPSGFYYNGNVYVIQGDSSGTLTVTSVPQNLQATGSNAQVSLSWSVPSSNGGSPIIGYNIYRGTTSGGENSTPVATGITSTSYSDTTSTNGQTYFYKVTAVNSVGESTPSNEASATPTAPATVSSAPTGLTATTISSSQLNLSWTAPANNGGSTITGYMIERSNNTGATWSTVQSNTGSTATTYSDSGLAHSATYTYRVSAINSVGTSFPSNTVSATTFNTVPSPPTGLTATAGTLQINLSWNAPSDNGGTSITGYMIERSTDGGNTWSTISSNTGSTGTTYSDTNVLPMTAYTYRVSAINGIGTSAPSNTASATIGMATTSSSSTSNGIVLNNVQSTSGTTSPSNQITLSNFNAGTGSNQLLVVGISANNNNVASVTFGGVPLTQRVMSFYNNDAEFWYLKNPGGTGNIVVTMSGPTQAVVGAYSFSGVNQTSPLPTSTIRHNTTPNSPNITITTKFANDWVLDLPSIYGGSTLGSPTCTQQWNLNVPNAITGASSSTVVQSPSTVTCKWTASSADFWDDVAVEVNASK